MIWSARCAGSPSPRPRTSRCRVRVRLRRGLAARLSVSASPCPRLRVRVSVPASPCPRLRARVSVPASPCRRLRAASPCPRLRAGVDARTELVARVRARVGGKLSLGFAVRDLGTLMLSGRLSSAMTSVAFHVPTRVTVLGILPGSAVLPVWHSASPWAQRRCGRAGHRARVRSRARRLDAHGVPASGPGSGRGAVSGGRIAVAPAIARLRVDWLRVRRDALAGRARLVGRVVGAVPVDDQPDPGPARPSLSRFLCKLI